MRRVQVTAADPKARRVTADVGRIAASPVAVSAATYRPVTIAAGSIATLFGIDLAGTSLVLVDGKGRTYDATIFFSSAGQINFQIPENIPLGGAVIRVVRDQTTRASNAMMVADVEPGLFTADASGRGLAAGLAVVGQDGRGELVSGTDRDSCRAS
jgi:uncharacterized protein (TIGR03437 family)